MYLALKLGAPFTLKDVEVWAKALIQHAGISAVVKSMVPILHVKDGYARVDISLKQSDRNSTKKALSQAIKACSYAVVQGCTLTAPAI